MKRVAILISGTGSNMLNLCKSMISENYAEPVLVLSDTKKAKGLSDAEQLGVNTRFIEFADRKGSNNNFEQKLIYELECVKPDIICLAGFMRILSQYFLEHFPEKIINIHPSILPKYKGLNTHSRAISALEKEAGCTVHRVTKIVDDGLILGQATVPIDSNETSESLAKKVLKLEHVLYPIVLRRLVS
jgi:phosphoribosylglycinamide formyltransferase-1